MRTLRVSGGIVLLLIGWSGWWLFPSIPFSSSLDRYLPGEGSTGNTHLMVSLENGSSEIGVDGVKPVFESLRSLPYVEDATDPISLMNRSGWTLESVIDRYSTLKQNIPFLRTIPFVESGGRNLNGLYRLSTEGLDSTEILADLDSIRNQNLPEGWTLYAGGEPVINGWLTRKSVGTQRRLFFLLVLASGLIMFLLYRSLKVFGALLVIISAAVGYPFLIMGILGYPHDLLSILAPLLVLVIGLASGIHFLNEYFEATGMEEQRVNRAMRRKWKPALLCHLTTAIGFGSLAISGIPAVRGLGVTTLFGLTLMSVLYFVAFPVLIRWFSPDDRRLLKGVEFPLGSVFHHKWSLGIITVTAVGLMAWGIMVYPGLGYETRALTYFQTSHPVRKQFDVLSNHFIPPRTGRIELIFPGKENIPSSTAQTSLKQAASAIEGIHTFTYSNNRDRETWNQSRDSARLNPDFFVTFEGLADLGSIRERLRTIVRDHFPDVRAIRFSGVLDRIYRAQHALKRTLYQSLLVSGGLIFGILGVYLRHVPLFLSVVFVNLFPILSVLGVMGLLGYSLNAGTIVIFSMILGLAVNDTIHLTHHVREGRGDMLSSLRRNARPVLFTSLILATGLSVFALADFEPVKQFGMFTTLGIGFALAGDFLVLPTITQIFLKEEF